MRLQCECTYCGHRWLELYSPYNLEYYKKDAKCPKCKDKNLRFKEEAHSDVFGYNYKGSKDEKRTI